MLHFEDLADTLADNLPHWLVLTQPSAGQGMDEETGLPLAGAPSADAGGETLLEAPCFVADNRSTIGVARATVQLDGDVTVRLEAQSLTEQIDLASVTATVTYDGRTHQARITSIAHLAAATYVGLAYRESAAASTS